MRDASHLAATARTRVQIPPPLLFGRAAMQLRQRTELVREAEANPNPNPNPTPIPNPNPYTYPYPHPYPYP